MKALSFHRKPVRYAAAAVSSKVRAGAGARWGLLRLDDDAKPPKQPSSEGSPIEGWQRVYPRLSGICGSDLATIDGKSARYFEDYVSFPFVPGHEIVADTSDGRRVVVEPVLGHEARGFDPPFDQAAPGDGFDYRHLTCGHLKPGLQTGYCASTGGGWATELIAHETQLHQVPANFSDEQAVIIEPLAGGVHAALRSKAQAADTVAVIGAGTMGLLATVALRQYNNPANIIVGGRYSTQRQLALQYGADIAVDTTELTRAVRRAVGSFMIGDHLSGGADIVIDAVGSSSSLSQALSLCRPRGRVVVLGMPATVSLELTALWHREIEMVGCYAYGSESLPDGRLTTSMELAFEMAAKTDFGALVSATYPLSRYEDALSHAAEAGHRGAVKIAFDMRDERRRGI